MACNPEESMGMRFGLEDQNTIIKRKFRWLFKIKGISAWDSGGQIRALPHRRGSRPSLSWKEEGFQHITETIYFPFKPDWKPIQLHLYDLRCNFNPVFDWIKYSENGSGEGMYNPETGAWRPVISAGIKRDAELLILDGCHNTIERWDIEGCYPQNIDWGELDMDNSDVVTVDLMLRYDRAYISNGNSSGSNGSSNGTNGGGGFNLNDFLNDEDKTKVFPKSKI